MDASGALPRELTHVHISSEPLNSKYEIELLSPSKRKGAQKNLTLFFVPSQEQDVHRSSVGLQLSVALHTP